MSNRELKASVTIVTVTFNSSFALRRFSQCIPADVAKWVVVDNASQDDSVELVESLGAEVIRLPSNVGFARANNIGVDASDSNVILFLNPDVTVIPDDIGRIAADCLALNGIVSPQLLNGDGSMQENGRGTPFLYRKLLHMLWPWQSRRNGYERRMELQERSPVAWVMGAALAIPRSLFENVGGWDSRFFLYYEDADLCLRTRSAGHPVLVDGNYRWVHGWARETKRKWRSSIWKLEFRSAIFFYRKYPLLLLHPSLLPRFLRPAYIDEA